MSTGGHRWRSAGAHHALCLGLALWLAGCAAPAPLPPDPTAGSGGGAAPVAGPPPTVDRPADAAARPAPDSVRVPPPGPPRPDAPPAATVAILFSAGAPSQAAIAGHIGEGLTGPALSVRSIAIDGPDRAARIDAAAAPGTGIVAAVGPDALAVARRQFADAAIVFCQVLAPFPGDAAGPAIRGVAPTPPPALQFAAWAEVDPALERIGLITSQAFADSVPEAETAAAAIGAELVHRVSTSDRETLFLFRRLVPEIDGLWLAPDSTVLSTAVIEEMLALAAELEIGVLVFSESLLERGGLISVAAPPEHVAATIVAAIERARAEGIGSLPPAIPLGEGAVRVNPRVAAALGLPGTTPTEWVVRARN